jgi:UDP-glucuronate decarboxylase
MNQKRILVTGGAGFIGSHLCKKLIEMGHYVICLDNNFTGSIKNINELIIESNNGKSNFEFIRHDITQPILLEVDEIYHLACPASPKAYQYNSIKTIKTNILGTLNSLGIAKRTKAKILLTSTSEIYGDPLISPQNEEYWGNVNPIGIRSCYDEGKRVAETLMIEYKRNHNVDIRIARIFNTYGPNMNKEDGRVVSNFINQILDNKDFTIYGDGSQTRSFCYVDDMVEGLIKLMDCEKYIGPVNLGNPHEITIKNLANKIKSLIIESSSKIIYKDLPQDDPTKRKPDINKAIRNLKWNPLIDLDEGLNSTINYFKML